MMKQNLELVEKLIEKTGISYAEAKQVLEKTDWDILEAMILLEAEGKIKDNKTTSSYTTKSEQANDSAESFKETTKSFGDWICKMIDKGNSNCLEMYRSGERKLSVPVTVFVILFIFCFWIIIPLMVVSLFFDCRYSFKGPDLGTDGVNSAMGKASDVANSIKTEINKTDTKKQQ